MARWSFSWITKFKLSFSWITKLKLSFSLFFVILSPFIWLILSLPWSTPWTSSLNFIISFKKLTITVSIPRRSCRGYMPPRLADFPTDRFCSSASWSAEILSLGQAYRNSCNVFLPHRWKNKIAMLVVAQDLRLKPPKSKWPNLVCVYTT